MSGKDANDDDYSSANFRKIAKKRMKQMVENETLLRYAVACGMGEQLK